MIKRDGPTAVANAAASLTALEEINLRLAAIVPEQFVTPSLERDRDAHVACIATEQIKRIFTLRIILTDEIDALKRVWNEAFSEGLKIIFSNGPDRVFNVTKEMKTVGSPLQVADEKIMRLANNIVQKRSFAKIVDELFWTEVRRQHEDLQEHYRLCICKDWSLCWRDSNAATDMPRVSGNMAELGKQLQRLFRSF